MVTTSACQEGAAQHRLQQSNCHVRVVLLHKAAEAAHVRLTVLPMHTHVTATAGCVVMLMMYVVSWRSLTVVSAPANLMPVCKHNIALLFTGNRLGFTVHAL